MTFDTRLAVIRKNMGTEEPVKTTDTPEVTEPALVDVAKAQLKAQASDMAALRVDLEKSDNAEHVELAKNLGAAEAKIAGVAAALNLDPQDDDLRWKVSRALGKLKDYAELMRLLGENGFMKAETPETPTEPVVVEEVTKSIGSWPGESAESVWGPDSKV